MLIAYYQSIFGSCFTSVIGQYYHWTFFGLNYVWTVCLDGSPAGYHYAQGFGEGVDNWLVYLPVSSPTYILVIAKLMRYIIKYMCSALSGWRCPDSALSTEFRFWSISGTITFFTTYILAFFKLNLLVTWSIV